MQTVILSSKFQIGIPKKTRENLGLKAGQKLVLIEKGNSFELVRIGSLRDAKGFIGPIGRGELRDHSERFG